ncbi:MAG: SGNH/GDSL hydrolase family protein [Pseudomonadota bacterium]
MQKSPITRLVTTAAATLALGLSALPAQAGPYTLLVAFGDSLSDAAGGDNTFPFAPNEGGLVTPAPYTGGRFSNGKVAVEVLAESLGLAPHQTFQFAIGGARTGTGGAIAGTGLSNQVQFFATNLAPGLGDLSGGLFSVWAGANDFRDALALANPTTAFGTIFSNLSTHITTLYGLGARDFLLPNLPDVGLTPEGLASGNSAAISMLSLGFNQALRDVYDQLEAQLLGADFHHVDSFAAQHALLAGAPGNGLSNTTAGCLLTLAGTPAGLDCNSAFFVDNIHPTTQVHQVLGEAMLAAVVPAAVPEPSAMLLTATALLGLVAASARRRRRR